METPVRSLVPLAAATAVAVAVALGTAGAAGSVSPSAGGGTILFLREDPNRQDSASLYSINADGTGERRLASAIHRAGRDADGDCLDDRTFKRLCFPVEYAQWSPDGSRVTFTRFGAGLYVADADGRSQRRIVPGYAFDPDWSPNGRRIVFQREVNDDRYLYIAEVSGPVRRLRGAPAGSWQPAWSRDGRTIAFLRVRGPRTEVWVIRPTGSGRRMIATAPLIPDPPTWSADSRWLAYATNIEGDVIVIHPNGTGKANITRSLDVLGGPEWSPVGSAIAYEAYRSCGFSMDFGQCLRHQVAVQQTTTSPRQQVDDSDQAFLLCGCYRTFAWSPDGTRIAFTRDYSPDGSPDGMYVKTLGRPGLDLVIPESVGPLDWTSS